MAKVSFICANTKDGFYSLQNEIVNKEQKRVYIIKGGPGTGKSTLMKRIGAALDAKEYVYCSSDPDSLDGVVLKDGTVFFDGTAPHTAEPPIPGAAGGIINTGDFWDAAALENNREEISELYGAVSDVYAAAYRLLSAAGETETLLFESEKRRLDLEKIKRYADNFARRRLPSLKKSGRLERRFADALCHKGEYFLEGVFDGVPERICLKDGGKAAADRIMKQITAIALKNGYDVTEYRLPLMPEAVSHAVIKEAGICFTTRGDCATRNMDCGRFQKGKEDLAKTRFYSLLSKSAKEAATERFKEAKTLHDKLEEYYIKAQKRDDFDAAVEKIIASLS